MRLEPPYSFRHALFRQVLYDRTAPSARMQLHRKVGRGPRTRARRRRRRSPPRSWRCISTAGAQPMAALRYYAEAAEAALLNFSPAACMSLDRARADPGAAGAGGRRARRAGDRRSQRCTACRPSSRSASGAQAKTAFERAYALLAGAPEHPMRGRLLHGFGYVLEPARRLCAGAGGRQRAEALAAVSNDPELMLVACFLHGEAHHLQGRTQAARSWMERGLAIAETLDLGGERRVRGGPASHAARHAGHRPRPLRPGATRPRAGAAGACARASSCASR